MKLRLGTRGSELARSQSGHIAERLRQDGHDVELVTIRSAGDVTTGSLLDAGGLGLFAAALRVALLDGQVDLVVHSLKDLPTAPVSGLTLGAIPPRAQAADVLCARDGLTLATLPPGARVGTGSPRRAAQVLAARPDIRIVEIRGNVGTRLARALSRDADLDAVVLAAAGLDRIGSRVTTETLQMLPAPGQGALAVECRTDDSCTLAALSPLDSLVTRYAVVAERAVLSALGAGCAAPVGAMATLEHGEFRLRTAVFSADGHRNVEVTRTAELPCPLSPARPLTQEAHERNESFAERLGTGAALELLRSGAADITPLGATRPSELADFHTDQALWSPSTRPELIGRRILLPRRDGALAEAIRAAGADVDAVPLTRTDPLPFALPGVCDWVVLTSPVAVEVLRDAGVDLHDLGDRVAAVGVATATAIRELGVEVDLVPPGRANAETLLALLIAKAEPASVVIPGSALSRPVLADGLTEAGWDVETVATYTTRPAEVAPTRPWADYDAVVLTSGSVAAAAAALLGPASASVAVIAFGQITASAAAATGWQVSAVADTQDAPGVIAALTTALTQETA